jgi:hypothetical protein
LLVVFIALAACGIINAQSISRSEYEETTLSDYTLWANRAQNGDVRRFKASVMSVGQTGIYYSFGDLGGKNFAVFDVEKRWPAMKENQQVTIYFTATGRTTRVINDIDYGDTDWQVADITASPIIPPPIPAAAALEPIDRSEYEETTLSDYEVWLNQVEIGDTKKFKASVLFSMESKTTLYFTDLNEKGFTGFEIKKDRPSLQAKQPVVIYFTAAGSMTRIIDDIDYAAEATGPVPGNASAQPRQDSPRPAAPPAAARPVPAAPPPSRPTPPAAARPTPAPPVPRAPTTARAAAKLTGSIPQRGSKKIYRLQVGSYLVSANAIRAFNQLRNEGLRPAYEKYGNYTRVVLSGIRADDVSRYAEKIGALGFAEIWCREER